MWLVTEYAQIYTSNAAGIAQGGSAPLINQSVIRRDLTIEIALIIATISLLSRKLNGFLISLIALVWVVVEYIGWYVSTRRGIVAAGFTQLPAGMPRAWNLAGATPWNVVVLVIAISLLLWEARVVTQVLRSRN
jgi:hypothetical protein